jgi:hypothetical protein
MTPLQSNDRFAQAAGWRVDETLVRPLDPAWEADRSQTKEEGLHRWRTPLGMNPSPVAPRPDRSLRNRIPTT